MFSIWGSSGNEVCTCCFHCQKHSRQKLTGKVVSISTFLPRELCLTQRSVTFFASFPQKKSFFFIPALLNLKLVGICRYELRLESTERWRKSSASDQKTKSLPLDENPRSIFVDCWQSQRCLMFLRLHLNNSRCLESVSETPTWEAYYIAIYI